MTPAEREALLTRFAETRERLLRAVHDLSPEQILYRPEPGRWSVAENIEHLVVVENRVVGAIEKVLQGQPDFSKQSALKDEDVLGMVGTVVRRVQAPPPSLPTSRWPPEELVPEFEKARRHTQEFAIETGADLRRHFMPHFLFGELDCYQWLLLLGAHCRRHCAQSEQVKASPGFPR